MHCQTELEEKYHAAGQGHVFKYWSELTVKEQKDYLVQLNNIDLERSLRAWSPALCNNAEKTDLTQATAIDGTNLKGDELSEFSKQGEGILAEGRIAALTVAGGQGTRLGHVGPKGTYKCTPLSEKPLFQLFAETLYYYSQKYGSFFEWFIMTSEANHQETESFFANNHYFGYPREKIHLFKQGMLPVFGRDGKFLLESKNKIAMSPDGHGGCLQALKKSGLLQLMSTEGIDYVSYFQIDNPLVYCLDPTFLGLHENAGAEMSSKAVSKVSWDEKVGTFLRDGGRIKVVEYSDIPIEVAQLQDENGDLLHGLGSIAIHLINRTFIESLVSEDNNDLPYHRAHKAVPCLNEIGELMHSAEPNGIKLESFIFDALPRAKNSIIYKISRKEEFGPIKNKTGVDSIISSHELQMTRSCRWVDLANIPRETDRIEISPSFAPTSHEFICKSAKMKFPIPLKDDIVLEINGLQEIEKT